jgi:hypothetical protein
MRDDQVVRQILYRNSNGLRARLKADKAAVWVGTDLKWQAVEGLFANLRFCISADE